MRRQATFYFFITLLSVCIAFFQWPLLRKNVEKPVSFFERSDLKVVAVTEKPSCCYRLGNPKLYFGSDKWRKGQEKAHQARESIDVKKKYFGLFQTERSVIRSKPPCLPGQTVDQSGFCRTRFHHP